MTRYQWDYPTKGTRFPRTSAEAFGPYCGMRSSPRFNWSNVLYWAAGAVTIAALALAAL